MNSSKLYRGIGIALAGLLILGTASVALADPPTGVCTGGQQWDGTSCVEKLVICHATGSGYIHNEPSRTADAGGHAGDTHQDGDDIIPPFNYDGGTFSGQNWDATGQEIYNNNCVDPNAPTTGSITIDKDVTGANADGSLDFTFDPSWSTDNILLSGDDTEVQTSGLAEDTYTVVESDPDTDWALTDIQCTGQTDSTITPNISGRSVQIELVAGENVTCTFTNTYSDPGTGGDPTGSIEITKYACPVGTTVIRSLNGVGEDVPDECVLQTGANFGYVHGTQADTGGPEYPELNEPIIEAGSTISGILTIINLPATGRYLIVESDGAGNKLPHEDVLGLYCEGDGDTSDNNDNQELTLVSENGVAHCIAYNEAVLGCTDPEANNYNPEATADDGSCDNSCQDELEGGWADNMVGTDQGTLKNGSPITNPDRIDPNKAVGPADWVPNTGTNFYSLGVDGWIVLSFDKFVPNLDGDDLSVHEGTNGTYPEEKAKVEVSQDGSTWYVLTEEASNLNSGNVSYLDFSETGLAWIKFVRITDTTDYALHAADADGFDLDAVDATQELCDQPEEEPDMCDLTVVSDTTNIEGGDNALVVTFIHTAWTALIPGATWIWGDDPVADPVGETIQTFTKTFNWNGPVASAVLDIAADNSYSVELNGNAIGADAAENNHALATQDQYNVAAGDINEGLNTLEITVTNKALQNGTITTNPAGLLYKLSVLGSGDGCTPPEDDDGSITIDKVVAGDNANADEVFSFDLNWLGDNIDDIDATLSANDAPETFSGLAAGEYSISELISTDDDWYVTNVTCTPGTLDETYFYDGNGEEDVSIELAAGEDVTCTFENTYRPGEDNDDDDDDDDGGGGGSSSRRRRGSSSSSDGEVLGEQVSILPLAAPATGNGGLKMCIE